MVCSRQKNNVHSMITSIVQRKLTSLLIYSVDACNKRGLRKININEWEWQSSVTQRRRTGISEVTKRFSDYTFSGVGVYRFKLLNRCICR